MPRQRAVSPGGIGGAQARAGAGRAREAVAALHKPPNQRARCGERGAPLAGGRWRDGVFAAPDGAWGRAALAGPLPRRFGG